MSEYNWYSLDRMLYDKKNTGRNSMNTERIYFRDFLNHFKYTPEDFTAKMALDMNIAIVAKINKILTEELDNNGNYTVLNANANPNIKNKNDFEREYYKEIMNIAYRSIESDINKNPSGSKPSPHTFTTNFESELSIYSAKGKKGYISEFKLLIEDLSLFKETSWYADLNSEILFRHVNVSKVPVSIGAKNFLLSLEIFFPFLKNDELYKNIKDDFFQKYYNKFIQDSSSSVFHTYPLSEIFSFIKDYYNEDVLKKVVSSSKGITGYSYLKNKSAVDKIINLYPESKEVLKSYIDEIKEDSIGDIFREDNYKIISVTIDFVEVQKILLLDKLKASTYDIKDSFKKILENEKDTRVKQNKNNPLSFYFTDDLIANSAKKHIVSYLFKVPNNENDKIDEELIKKFIKNQFLSFVNEYPKKSDLDKYDVLWQEFLIKKELNSLPLQENKTQSVVKKF